MRLRRGELGVGGGGTGRSCPGSGGAAAAESAGWWGCRGGACGLGRPEGFEGPGWGTEMRARGAGEANWGTEVLTGGGGGLGGLGVRGGVQGC